MVNHFKLSVFSVLISSHIQIVPEKLVDLLFKACHSDSYERLQYTVKVRFGKTFTYTQKTNNRKTRTCG